MSLQDVTSESVLKKEKKTGFTFRGREIVLSKTRGRPMAEGIQKKQGWYPDEKRIEVVSLYACIGNPDTISDLTGVSVGTIRGWRRQEWFVALLEEIRDENNEKLDANFTQIVQKAQDLILDRLENGDFVLTKDGELIRKPVNARDLALTSAITVDKRQIIRNKPTSISEQHVTPVIGRLEQLAETFKTLAQGKKIDFDKKEEIQDIEFEEIVTNAEETGTGTQEKSEEKGIKG